MSKITSDGFNPVWHRMRYSCTHMATVGVKGLKRSGSSLIYYIICFTEFLVSK